MSSKSAFLLLHERTSQMLQGRFDFKDFCVKGVAWWDFYSLHQKISFKTKTSSKISKLQMGQALCRLLQWKTIENLG